MQNDKIKVGAVLVAVKDNNFYGICQINKGEPYTIDSVSEADFSFYCVDRSCYIYKKDIYDFFKFKEEPTEDEIKVGDEYVGNASGLEYKVKEIIDVNLFRLERDDDYIGKWTIKEIKQLLTKKPKPSVKEAIEEAEGFYMVAIEGINREPRPSFDNYADAFSEALRLSEKENKTAYVMKAISQVEQVSKITKFKK